MWLLLICTGYFLRGPNWQFYLPWEAWEAMKYASRNLWSLEPMAGIAGLALYFVAGLLVPRFIIKDFYIKCGPLKYTIVMVSLLLMYFVPIKIFLRLAFNIRYVLVTPWFNI